MISVAFVRSKSLQPGQKNKYCTKNFSAGEMRQGLGVINVKPFASLQCCNWKIVGAKETLNPLKKRLDYKTVAQKHMGTDPGEVLVPVVTSMTGRSAPTCVT